MNTIQSLTEHGIELYTAEKMIESCKDKIGTMNGVYLITDITYDFDIRGRIVTLKCSECGKVISRTIVSGRNKWSELIKSCTCKKEKEKKLAFEKSEKIKKEKKAIAEQKKIEKERRRAEYNPIKYDESYIGQKFNYLEIIGFEKDKRKHRKFKCKCDCGKIKIIEPFNVVNGIEKSCGCMHSILSSKNSTTHGLSKTRLYSIWSGMKYRCYNSNCENYSDYGGRGILICEEWLNEENGLRNFIGWAISHGYSDDLSIDRIDVNGNYEPNNCRWADWFTQANNRRPMKRRYIIDGVRYSMQELCEMYDTSEPAVRYRMKSIGMTLEQALKTPKYTNGRPRKEKVV